MPSLEREMEAGGAMQMWCSPHFDPGLLAASCMYIHSSLAPQILNPPSFHFRVPPRTQHTITPTQANPSARPAKPSAPDKMTPPAVTKEVVMPAEEGTDSGAAKKQKVGVGGGEGGET